MSRIVPRSRASASMKHQNIKKFKSHTDKLRKGVPDTTRSLNDNFLYSSDTASNLTFDNDDDGTLNNIGLFT